MEVDLVDPSVALRGCGSCTPCDGRNKMCPLEQVGEKIREPHRPLGIVTQVGA